MVGSTILFSPFECAATRPTLNAILLRSQLQFHHGCSSWIWGSTYIAIVYESKVQWSKLSDFKARFQTNWFTWSCAYNTAIRLMMTALCPLLQAQNFHHKLLILLEAVNGCKLSSHTHQSHDFFMYDWPAYHQVAALNGVIEPQASGCLHWHIMLYSSVLSPELLEKATAAPIEVQTRVADMLDSITHTKLHLEIHQ